MAKWVEARNKKSSRTKFLSGNAGYFRRYVADSFANSACANARGCAPHVHGSTTAFKFCAIRIHFERGQAVICACGACGSRRPGRGNNSRVKGDWGWSGSVRETAKENAVGKKKEGCRNGKRVEWRGERKGEIGGESVHHLPQG